MMFLRIDDPYAVPLAQAFTIQHGRLIQGYDLAKPQKTFSTQSSGPVTGNSPKLELRQKRENPSRRYRSQNPFAFSALTQNESRSFQRAGQRLLLDDAAAGIERPGPENLEDGGDVFEQ